MGNPNGDGAIIPVGGKGLGSFEQYGCANFVIDTGGEGYPEGSRIDVMLIPVGEVQPVAAIQIPRGAGVIIYHPELMEQLRAQVKKVAATKADAPHNPARKG